MAENVFLKGTVWTEKDDDFLRTYYIQLSQRAMALRLARTKGEIQYRLKVLDLKLTSEQKILKKQAAGYKMCEQRELFWTEEKNAFLKENYPQIINEFLSKRLGVSIQAIIAQANKLGLKKSEVYMNKMMKEIIPAIRYCSRKRV